jgi:serine/threonine-protein kinase
MIRRIDRYELLEPVGTGGMAVVYRGRDVALDREVAVKLLHPHLASRSESRARFSREARAVARLSHPNIVEIYDYAGEAATESYLVTEFVHGRTLRAFADEEGVGFPEVGALVARALADALVHAHGAGVIHRDLKPENVLLLEAGRRRAVKLVDFGIARIVTSDEKMTMTGALVGSPNHMAPEIIEGREADARSDVFSLGTLLYWLAVGRMPFAAPNPTATLRRVIDGDYEEPRRASALVSDALAAAMTRALAADPARRTPSAAALRDDLDAALAASGLDDAEAELAAFLTAPRDYKAALPARLVAFALARADAALAAGETARAMKDMNRVLALDPANAEITARLARIERRARVRRAVRRASSAALLAIAIAGAAWGGTAAWRQVRRGVAAATKEAIATAVPAANASATPNPTSSSTSIATATATANATANANANATPNATSTSNANPTATLAPLSSPSARVRGEGWGEGSSAVYTPRPRLAAATLPGPPPPPAEVVAIVRPYAQRALLDGAEVASGVQRVSFALAPGAPHRIQIEHACCFPYVREFAANEPVLQRLELKVPLLPRPARLRVDADAATRVFVDGRAAGSAEESQRTPIEVPVPATGDTPYEVQVELRLEREGAQPVRTAVRLRAGAEVTFAAPPAQPEPLAPSAAAAPDGRGEAAP